MQANSVLNFTVALIGRASSARGSALVHKTPIIGASPTGAVQCGVRSASSWQYNQRNSTTFGGTTWRNHYATSNSGGDSRSPMLIDPPSQSDDNSFIKVLVAIFASIYVGGKIAQKAATFLEENEIFVHTDDEDDD